MDNVGRDYNWLGNFGKSWRLWRKDCYFLGLSVAIKTILVFDFEVECKYLVVTGFVYTVFGVD